MKQLLLMGLLLVSSLGFTQELDSVYEVPGFNGAAEALFPVTFNLHTLGNVVSVDYVLPELLTGVPNQIIAEGTMVTSNMAVLKGPKSHLTCDIPNKVCSVTYKSLDIDLNLVQEKLHRLGLPEDRMHARLEVARRFVSDPEGAIHYGKKY